MLRWIERHAAVFLVLALGGLAFLGHELKGIQDQLSAGSRTQLLNRATNVEKWCDGINEGRDYDRRFVRRAQLGHPHSLPYTLGDLPCEQLIRKTLTSASRRTVVTARSNPLTYRALH